jgi:DNA processing protein
LDRRKARGIDAIGHTGATAVGGKAIGVIGTGIDVWYPKENKKLYEKVLERGAIVSELPTGSHPAPENFPVRNRIIAGMPLGVVIVEGKQYSGSLITARLATEFGREVWSAGQRDARSKLCAEPVDQAGSKTGDQRGRCD